MSIFNRKQKTEKIERNSEFEIFQFIKVDGLRSDKKEKFVPTEFVSPIFGTTVKDETVAPYVNVGTGDKQKQYDFLRNEPLGDMSEYAEFRSVLLTKESRKEIFGEDAVIDSERKYIDKRLIKEELVVPYTGKKVEENFVESFGKYEQPQDELKIANPVFEQEALNHKDEYVEEKREGFVEEKRTPPILKPNYVEPEVYAPEKHDDIFKKEAKKETPRPQTPMQRPVIQQEKRSYIYPSASMFSKVQRDQHSRPQWLIEQEEAINRTLKEFNVDGEVRNIVKGPTVTRHEIELEPGVNVKSVSSIEANLRMSLAAVSTRIEAPIPGKPYVGLEVPNKEPEIVAFGNVVDDPDFLNSKKPLTIALGVDIDGKNIYADIQSMPHGLVAGATNSGKSVCINTIIMSLLMKNHPDDLKFILIDPKMVELSAYNDIPHLATPVITDSKVAATALSWAVEEMDNRFVDFANARVRDLAAYNEKALTDSSLNKKPFIVIIIDELADLMAVSSVDVEQSIQRITQKARAAGIHLLVATQRPTTDVVKGTIKANIPTRIAFRVASFTDSTTILDSAGAEQLLGRGDMLYKLTSRPIRLQGAYIKDKEIDEVTDFIRRQMKPEYLIDFEELKTFQYKKEVLEEDDLIGPVTEFVVREQTASINRLQTEFQIGFNRAQKLIEILEQQGIVSQSEGTKARKVLVSPQELGIED